MIRRVHGWLRRTFAWVLGRSARRPAPAYAPARVPAAAAPAAPLAADAVWSYCEACGHAVAVGPDGRAVRACGH